MSSTPVRRGLAVVAALGLTAGAAVATAPATTAAPLPATGASAVWGVKETWATYMSKDGGTTTLGGGASASPRFSWPASATAGSYDPATGAATVRLAGSVTFSKPKYCITELTLANPTVVLDGKGGGRLLADVRERFYVEDGGFLPVDCTAPAYAAKRRDLDREQLHVADLKVVKDPVVAPSGGTTRITVRGAKVVLNATGAGAFDGFYPAGTEIDPLDVSFTVGARLKASSTATLKVAKKQRKKLEAGKKGKVVVRVKAAGDAKASGKVQLKDKGKVVGKARLKGKGKAVLKVRLKKPGRHVLRAVYPGDGDVRRAVTTKVVVRVKKK